MTSQIKSVLDYLHNHSIFHALKVDKDIDALHTKNLFLRDQKKENYYLVVMGAHDRLDLKSLARVLYTKKLSFASEKDLMKYLGLTPGSVSPFGLINDVDAEVDLYVQKKVLDADFVGFHPNLNTATLRLSKEMFKKFLDSVSHKVNLLQ
jgi:Ala-tRNA(Pro) deacylase